MLTFPSHKANASQNHMRFHLNPARTPPPTNAGKDAGKKELSYTAGGNVSEYSHHGKQYGGFLKN
jgi:hypothetical protein